MAINLGATYPGRVFVDGENPRGTFKDSDPAGSFNGTPAQYAWARDMWAFLEKLLDVGGITASGTPDTAVNSERYDALLLAARDVWPLWDSSHTYLKGILTLGSDNKLYQSLQAANLDKNPTSQPSWWKIFEPILVIDDLLSTDPSAALSANQGRILKNLFDTQITATRTVKGVSLLSESIIFTFSGTTVIKFFPGVIEFDDGTGQAATSQIPFFDKIINSSWSPGTGGGGLDTGSIAPNTWYDIYAIYNPGAELPDYVFTTSIGVLILPSGYTKKEYRGSYLTDSISQLVPFIQNKDIFTFLTPRLDVPGINVNNVSQFFAMSAPPGKKCRLTMNAFADATPSSWIEILVSDADTIDQALSVTPGVPPLANIYYPSNGSFTSVQIEVIASQTTAQVRVRTPFAANIALYLETYNYRNLSLKIR